MYWASFTVPAFFISRWDDPSRAFRLLVYKMRGDEREIMRTAASHTSYE
jgi:hypothetical protein